MFKKTDQANPTEMPEQLQEKDLEQAQGGVDQISLNYTKIEFEYYPRSAR